jgi:hypothetical protein
VIYTANKKKDEIANRLEMARGVLSDCSAAYYADHGENCTSLWAAQQLIQDAIYLFEELHFKGNVRQREKEKEKDSD